MPRITPQDISREAHKLIGVPWEHQGLNPELGIDCRGELIVIADRLGYQLKDYNNTYRRNAPAIELHEALDTEFEKIIIENATIGDVVLIKFPRDKEARHVGVLVEGLYELMIIHAYEPQYGGGEVIKEPYRRWQPYVKAAYRWNYQQV